MNKVKLYTNDGGFVAEVTVPPWKHPVELYVWGERFFIRRADGRYMEAGGAYWIPPEVQDAPAESKPLIKFPEPKPTSGSTPVGKGWPSNALPDSHPTNSEKARATVSGNEPSADGPAPTTEKLPDGQHKDHWALPEDQRKDGYVRPLRRSYLHVGPKQPEGLRDLTDEEKARYSGVGYVKFQEYPESESPKTGRYWTQAELDRIGQGCGAKTTMPLACAETYAKDPSYYGSTFCCKCGSYFPVGENGEFVWDEPPKGVTHLNQGDYFGWPRVGA